MHAAGGLKDHSANPWSIGCLTISVTDYYNFGVNAGFITPRAGTFDNYQAIKSLRNDIAPLLPEEEKWGYVVVNRDYMDDEEWEKFLGD